MRLKPSSVITDLDEQTQESAIAVVAPDPATALAAYKLVKQHLLGLPRAGGKMCDIEWRRGNAQFPRYDMGNQKYRIDSSRKRQKTDNWCTAGGQRTNSQQSRDNGAPKTNTDPQNSRQQGSGRRDGSGSVVEAGKPKKSRSSRKPKTN